MQTYSILRDRYQITIPDEVRKDLDWAKPKSVVSMEVTANNELLIKPYAKAQKVDWEKIWEGIKLARSIKGKHGNLSQFIIKDRERH